MQSAEVKENFKGWAVLELMGHRRLAGYVEEVEVASAKMLRITVHPKDAPPWQQYYGASALYCLSPVSEEVARRIMEDSDAQPRFVWKVNRAFVRDEGERLRQKGLPAPAEDEQDADDGDQPF